MFYQLRRLRTGWSCTNYHIRKITHPRVQIEPHRLLQQRLQRSKGCAFKTTSIGYERRGVLDSPEEEVLPQNRGCSGVIPLLAANISRNGFKICQLVCKNLLDSASCLISLNISCNNPLIHTRSMPAPKQRCKYHSKLDRYSKFRLDISRLTVWIMFPSDIRDLSISLDWRQSFSF